MFDTARDTFNVADNPLFANIADAEYTDADLDITSQGFKIRIAAGAGVLNTNGATFIYYAIADVSGKYSLGR